VLDHTSSSRRIPRIQSGAGRSPEQTLILALYTKKCSAKRALPGQKRPSSLKRLQKKCTAKGAYLALLVDIFSYSRYYYLLGGV